jgi:uncharacterized protein YeaO (DUF488 family)
MARRLPIRIQRVYEPPEPGDGYRVLVERLWPRGLTRERAALDAWAKDVSPSPALRTWYAHDPGKFEEFTERYRDELAASPAREVVEDLRRRAAKGPVTLVYAARDEERNSARVLRDLLLAVPRRRGVKRPA